ncbi:hypothetical protein D3C80_1519290 [compost metagenome]
MSEHGLHVVALHLETQLARAIERGHRRFERQRSRLPARQRQLLNRPALVLDTSGQGNGHGHRHLVAGVVTDTARTCGVVLAQLVGFERAGGP